MRQTRDEGHYAAEDISSANVMCYQAYCTYQRVVFVSNSAVSDVLSLVLASVYNHVSWMYA
jgi:hypothetical protein